MKPTSPTPNESHENVPNGTLVELLVDEVAEEKSAPENLLDQRDDDHEPQRSAATPSPSRRRLAGEDASGLKPSVRAAEAEERLRRNPENENDDADGEREEQSARAVENRTRARTTRACAPQTNVWSG